MRRALALYLFLTVLTGIHPASAEDRALLIGIGRYRINKAPLPEIEKDLDRMRTVAGVLGFAESQVRVLSDREATLDGIRSAIRSHLVRGVTSSDRALLYFTGHGSQVPDAGGDEGDGADEVLLTHDFEEHHGTLAKVLVDDELGDLLAEVPAREVVVLIDSCNSGSMATRSMSPLVSKFYDYPGMPSDSTRGFVLDPPRDELRNVVALGAAREDEDAQSHRDQGSLFTLAVMETVLAAAADRELSMEELRTRTAVIVARKLVNDPELLHHPTLYGNPELEDVNLFLPGSDLWAELEQLVGEASATIDVVAGRAVYRPGSSLRISLTAPRDGYLNVVNLGRGENELVLLFPNRYHTDNRVGRGEYVSLPLAGRFRLPAALPPGIDRQQNLIAVFHTVEPLNLYQVAPSTAEIFRTIRRAKFTTEVTRTLRRAGYRAGRVVVTIER